MSFDVLGGMGDKNIYYRNWVGMVYASFKKPENAVKKKRENKVSRMKKYIFYHYHPKFPWRCRNHWDPCS